MRTRRRSRRCPSTGHGDRGVDRAPSGDPDADVLERATDGDRAAFADLVRRHESRVYGLALRMLGRPEDARDATQDAFVAAFRRLSSFRRDARFSTWLHRIAVNVCLDALRRPDRARAADAEVPEPSPAPDHADGVAAAVDIRRALLGVPAEFRAVLVLHDVQDVPVEEVAEILGIPSGTVKSRLHRGRVALGRLLAGEPNDAPAPSNRSR